MRDQRTTRPIFKPGDLIGGCRISSLLGTGGMGEVYLADDLRLPRQLAIKTIRADLHGVESIQRFLKEAESLAKVSHPNVVVVHDIGHEREQHYIKMQYVDGRTLSELVTAQGGPLAWRIALRIMRLAAKGVQAVHQKGLIHRDIKPSNIMYSSEARVVLMDFGLVREYGGSDLTEPGQTVGTPPYMAPEQCSGDQPIGIAADIYSLGATLYFLLTARPPFEGTAVQIMIKKMSEQPTAIQKLNPLIPPEVGEFVKRAMSIKAEDRFAGTVPFLRQVETLLKIAVNVSKPEQDTSNICSSIGETAPLPELRPLQNVVIEETFTERLLRIKGWLAIGVGLFLLCVLSLLLPQLFPPASSSVNPSANTTIIAPPGMVRIERGHVIVGASADKLRLFFSKFPDLVAHPGELEDAVEANLKEAPGRFEIPAFWIDQYEVTNAEYAQFIRATGRRPPDHWSSSNPPPGKEDFPIDNIDYHSAEAYALWRGKRLPTLHQWVRAYRGDRDTLLPWGDDFRSEWLNVNENPAFPSTSPVKATPRDLTSSGVYNMVGNVMEYLRDDPSQVTIDPSEPLHHAKGSSFGQCGYIKGTATFRWTVHGNSSIRGLGVRCVSEDTVTSAPPAG